MNRLLYCVMMSSCGVFVDAASALADVDVILFLNFFQLFCFLWMNAVLQVRRRAYALALSVLLRLAYEPVFWLLLRVGNWYHDCCRGSSGLVLDSAII